MTNSAVLPSYLLHGPVVDETSQNPRNHFLVVAYGLSDS